MFKFKTIKTFYNVQKDNDKEERVVHETMDTDDLTFNDTNVNPYTQYKFKIVTTTAKGLVIFLYRFITYKKQ